jgi:hypothetical protein
MLFEHLQRLLYHSIGIVVPQLVTPVDDIQTNLFNVSPILTILPREQFSTPSAVLNQPLRS